MKKIFFIIIIIFIFVNVVLIKIFPDNVIFVEDYSKIKYDNIIILFNNNEKISINDRKIFIPKNFEGEIKLKLIKDNNNFEILIDGYYENYFMKCFKIKIYENNNVVIKSYDNYLKYFFDFNK